MKKFTILMLSGLAFAAINAQAIRVLEVIERSYELVLTDVSLPQSTNGTVGYKACDACARQYMPVSGVTSYFVEDRMMTLAQFSAEVARIRQLPGASERTLVMLHYDPETEVATRIRVNTL
jgi:hypothetical protein